VVVVVEFVETVQAVLAALAVAVLVALEIWTMEIMVRLIVVAAAVEAAEDSLVAVTILSHQVVQADLELLSLDTLIQKQLQSVRV
jgi:hypothetical protein